MAKSVAIIGAGVSGLTCAVIFAERGYRTAIFAAETGRSTTSAAAAAIWYPYDAEPANQVIAWALQSYKALADLTRDPLSGVSMIDLYTFSRRPKIEIPIWAEGLGARLLDANHVEIGLAAAPRNFSAVFRSGFALNVPLVDTTIYLDYLNERILAAGGSVSNNVRLKKFEEIPANFDTVIDCAGLGAGILAQDPALEPHRGQVVIVPKLNLTCAIVCDDPPLMYAIPRTNDCVFGGSNDLSEDCAISPGDTKRIMDECSRVLEIDPPQVLHERVGIRPFRRSGVRVERDRLSDGRALIHNYGHGGSGFTLSWGCAEEVFKLA
jgi:D-amino-acid oxidase